MNRQTTALGEVISAGKHFGPLSKALILDWIARRIDGQAVNGE
jgi:hypothetical protein